MSLVTEMPTFKTMDVAEPEARLKKIKIKIYNVFGYIKEALSCVCMCMYVCMYVCVYVCMCVWIYVFNNEWILI